MTTKTKITVKAHFSHKSHRWKKWSCQSKSTFSLLCFVPVKRAGILGVVSQLAALREAPLCNPWVLLNIFCETLFMVFVGRERERLQRKDLIKSSCHTGDLTLSEPTWNFVMQKRRKINCYFWNDETQVSFSEVFKGLQKKIVWRLKIHVKIDFSLHTHTYCSVD